MSSECVFNNYILPLGLAAITPFLALKFLRGLKLIAESSSSNSCNHAIERFDVDTRFTNSLYYRDLVFMSGQVGEGDTIEDQTQSALSQVNDALVSAGSHKSRILELTIWLADIERDYDRMNSIYDQWIESTMPPCRACVQAKLASDKYLIEVRCIAAKL